MLKYQALAARDLAQNLRHAVSLAPLPAALTCAPVAESEVRALLREAVVASLLDGGRVYDC